MVIIKRKTLFVADKYSAECEIDHQMTKAITFMRAFHHPCVFLFIQNKSAHECANCFKKEKF